jgi:protein-S-isoprenylcysteine O-methyltransferase Ste14
VRALAFLLFLVACFVAGRIYLQRTNPAVLAARRGIHPGTERSDRPLLALFRLAVPALFVTAALDAIWFHGPRVGLVPTILGYVTLGLGWAVMTWALRWNEFAEPGVRVQHDRGQRVVAEGPYAIVRHPMYTGLIAIGAGSALALGSYWSLLAAAAWAVILALRLVREERTLSAGLAGYDAYLARVRYRLVPGLW